MHTIQRDPTQPLQDLIFLGLVALFLLGLAAMAWVF
jgi:hypothetical protein